MSALAALLNLAMGAAYICIGAQAVYDLRRGMATRGFSHFGAAIAALAFTCGPHHLAHGLHIAFEGRAAGGIDVVAVLVGLPAGAVFCFLRFEAFRGGRGDRRVTGTPDWMALLPFAAASYLVLVMAAGEDVPQHFRLSLTTVPNLALVGLYLAIGYFLLRTQLANRASLGEWSLSGLSLTGIFPTCAVMHAAWVVYVGAGRYEFDIHGAAIDWVAVPAAGYFLWVVRGLYRGTLIDWNRGMVGAHDEVGRMPAAEHMSRAAAGAG